MKKTVLLYGLLGAVLIALLRLIEYRFLVVEHSLEIYGGLVAAIFAGLGIWLGQRLTRPKEAPQSTEHRALGTPFQVNAANLAKFGVTARELEILQLIAAGHSNREIAEKLFVSENTVKTHSANLFSKLNAKRRTQAVQIAKEAGVIP